MTSTISFLEEVFPGLDAEASASRSPAQAYIGIDPGVSGAIADWDGWVVDMPPNPRDLWQVLKARGYGARVVIETPGLRPGGGVHASFKIGQGYGQCIGVMAALSIPYVVVTPAKWKAHYNLLMPKATAGEKKEASRALARSLWPDAPLARKMDHGRAEALLLAEYGRRLSL
jgi:hypothetical protein